MTLVGLWQAVIRAIAALMLFLAIATPALAEIACAGERVTHLQAGERVGAKGQVTSGGDPQQQDEEDASTIEHCAFSHGPCVGIPADTNTSIELLTLANRYGRSVSEPLTPELVGTPHHPPNA
jgi:hypothetical protein